MRRSVEGGKETRIVDKVYRYNYVVLEDGLYLTPSSNADGSSSIRYLDFKTNASKEIAKS